ncbi:MAG: hypothetical protein J5663_11045 [Bacteroidaceae bacterium]|nr:hypothetical protein [Bacteroidaceae bacterium]
MKVNSPFVRRSLLVMTAIVSSSVVVMGLTDNRRKATVSGEGFEFEDSDDATEITAQYLVNPSFERDDIATLAKDNTRGAYVATSIYGWTLTGNYGVSDIMTATATATDNNFGAPGKPSNGTQMYYIRNAWTASTATLFQSITLPAGKYRLNVDNKCITASSHAAYLVAGDNNVSLNFKDAMPEVWESTALYFNLTTEKTINVGLRVDFGNGSGGSILVDNFRLYRLPDTAEIPSEPKETDVTSFTEGVINNTFVPEADMKRDLLQMLADFSTYMVNDFQECSAPNSKNEKCGCFKGENTMANDERGVRPNADLSMICAFLVKYAQPAGITLPQGVTYEKLEDMAMKSLVFAYSTHKANKLKVCSGNNYWGSTSKDDAVWESSLWAMSVAYSAYFQWNKLTAEQKGYIEKLLKAECNYELYRSIPTGYAGDTKAEENGWEADVLAATLGLFPDDELASKWFERMREMAINSYSHPSDANNNKVIDEWYDNKTVADLYRGQNLYDDYSLQNHNLFHTSYQNVVQQELGEAALALKMFQMGIKGEEKWKSNALMHHNQEVQDSILNWLALADGELAMPNGNDWSLFLYDQITSYSTQACFLRDANALMLENLAYKYIKARQKTTADGSWLLRADVGARRMGVEAHRVMMTYLMHDVLSTADVTPTSWADFNRKHYEARMIPCQNIVRAATDYRFTCFSWSNGLKSYTGYFAANSADKNKIVVPYRANNTGNIIGWYDVSGKSTNATPVVAGIYQLKGNGYVMNGELSCNDGALDNRFVIYSTPSNAIIYLDYVTANAAATISAEKGGLLAISTDELMKTKRTLYFDAKANVTNQGKVDTDEEVAYKQYDGSSFASVQSDWVNVDNELGVVGKNNKKIAFGDRGTNNSIYTSKLYPMYSNSSRSVKKDDVVDARNLVYYSLVNAKQTKEYANALVSLRNALPAGWNGVIAPDEECGYLLVSNFKGDNQAQLSGVAYNGLAPVFYQNTTIDDSKSSVTLDLQQNHSYAQPLFVLIKGKGVEAQLETDQSAYITAKEDATVIVYIKSSSSSVTIKKGKTVKVSLGTNGEVCAESVTMPTVEKKDYTDFIVNPSFEGNSSYGWTGGPTVDYNCAEKWNSNFNIYQTVTGLPAGRYMLTCQGFYRAGGIDEAVATHGAGTEKLNAVLYANEASVPLVSILSDAGKAGATGIVAGSYGYVPNTMEQTSVYFRKGLYQNSLVCSVGDDGKLTFGVKKSTMIGNDWSIFDNFTLTYLGENIPDAIGSLGIDAMQGTIYNLQGCRLTDITSSGIYVINGKKVRVSF